MKNLLLLLIALLLVVAAPPKTKAALDTTCELTIDGSDQSGSCGEFSPGFYGSEGHIIAARSYEDGNYNAGAFAGWSCPFPTVAQITVSGPDVSIIIYRMGEGGVITGSALGWAGFADNGHVPEVCDWGTLYSYKD